MEKINRSSRQHKFYPTMEVRKFTKDFYDFLRKMHEIVRIVRKKGNWIAKSKSKRKYLYAKFYFSGKGIFSSPTNSRVGTTTNRAYQLRS